MSQGERNRPSNKQAALPSVGRRRTSLESPMGVLTIVFVALLAVVFYSSGFSTQRRQIPDEIVGTWHTTASDYADRAFEIRKTSLVFYASENEWTVHLIDRIETEDLGGGTLFTVYYDDKGGTTEFSFYYDPKRDGIIRFKNQREMEWKRQT